jgi:hypothetical protein
MKLNKMKGEIRDDILSAIWILFLMPNLRLPYFWIQYILIFAFCFRGTPPAPRSDHAAACHAGRYLLIFGGGSHATCFNDLHVLDLETVRTNLLELSWIHCLWLLSSNVGIIDGMVKTQTARSDSEPTSRPCRCNCWGELVHCWWWQ